MKASRRPHCHVQLLLTVMLATLVSACTIVGPRAISTGRLAYNAAIAETNNQQMLMVLVHNRYAEQGSMLAVASVTANVSVKSSAGIQAGFGNDSNYDGNLVPFTGGVIYEENPTISYTPVAGEKYLNQLTAPLPISLLAQISRSTVNPTTTYVGLISSVNGIYNPDFILDQQDYDTRFDRFTALMSELTRAHRLNWVQEPGHNKQFSIVIDQSKPEYAARAKELMALLGLAHKYNHSPTIVVPVRMSLDGAAKGIIGITTRSIFDMVEILAARIDVPAEDISRGIALDYPPVGRVGNKLAIRYSAENPDHAYISVQHRGGWFYIDEADLATKEYFKLLGSLWSLAVAHSMADGPAAPVLTVPVSN
jgi:hypothetical protein